MNRIALMFAALLLAPAAQAGLLADNWMPEARTCPSDVEAFRTAVDDAVKSCRANASWTDALGFERVNPVVYNTCMADDGWTKGRRIERTAWMARCTQPESDTRIVESARSSFQDPVPAAK